MKSVVTSIYIEQLQYPRLIEYVLNKRGSPNKRGGWTDFFQLLHEKQWGRGNFFRLLYKKQGEGV